ncbi:MAG: hypothetical protein KGD63_14990 [Candidatus Lokiarchaeota archaeon]|nr:hypothetical protein [Candidatus Lokiarchaeota archaeon]
MDYIERNFKIIEEEMIQRMNNALNFGRELIDSELQAGLFNPVLKPLIKTFYDSWSKKNAKVGTLKQIKITLTCGKLLIQNGSGKEKFNDVIEENFQEYLEGDQTYTHCNRKNKNFEKLKDINKKLFSLQVGDVMKMMQTKENIGNYDELTRVVFKTKKDAYDALIKNINYNDEAIALVEKNPSILKIPIGKKIILKLLRKGFEHTKLDLIQYLDIIYN